MPAASLPVWQHSAAPLPLAAVHRRLACEGIPRASKTTEPNEPRQRPRSHTWSHLRDLSQARLDHAYRSALQLHGSKARTASRCSGATIGLYRQVQMLPRHYVDVHRQRCRLVLPILCMACPSDHVSDAWCAFSQAGWRRFRWTPQGRQLRGSAPPRGSRQHMGECRAAS